MAFFFFFFYSAVFFTRVMNVWRTVSDIRAMKRRQFKTELCTCDNIIMYIIVKIYLSPHTQSPYTIVTVCVLIVSSPCRFVYHVFVRICVRTRVYGFYRETVRFRRKIGFIRKRLSLTVRSSSCMFDTSKCNMSCIQLVSPVIESDLIRAFSCYVCTRVLINPLLKSFELRCFGKTVILHGHRTPSARTLSANVNLRMHSSRLTRRIAETVVRQRHRTVWRDSRWPQIDAGCMEEGMSDNALVGDHSELPFA